MRPRLFTFQMAYKRLVFDGHEITVKRRFISPININILGNGKIIIFGRSNGEYMVLSYHRTKYPEIYRYTNYKKGRSRYEKEAFKYSFWNM